MKYFCVILLAFFCNPNAPLAQDSTDYYIKSISWQSLFIKITYATELILNKDAENLISKKSDKTAKKIFCALSSESKTAVLHIVLSRMYEPQNSKIGAEYIYENDTIVGVKYSCNNFNWNYDTKKEKYSIEHSEVEKIKAYWEKKLPVLQKMSKSAKRKQTKKCNKALKRGL